MRLRLRIAALVSLLIGFESAALAAPDASDQAAGDRAAVGSPGNRDSAERLYDSVSHRAAADSRSKASGSATARLDQ